MRVKDASTNFVATTPADSQEMTARVMLVLLTMVTCLRGVAARTSVSYFGVVLLGFGGATNP